jgi:hypothetical protein
MPQYRAYIIGKDGRISSRVELLCPNDAIAKERAGQLVDDHAVELWQRLGKRGLAGLWGHERGRVQAALALRE